MRAKEQPNQTNAETLMLIYDSEDTGPIYADKHYVEIARLRWDEGMENRDIIKVLRENGLSLRGAAYILKHLELNYVRGMTDAK